MAASYQNPIHAKGLFHWSMAASYVSMIASMIGMVVAVIALGGIRAYWMAALAVICLGVAHLFEGISFGARIPGPAAESKTLVRSGLLTGRFPSGVVGIILGILSLVGVVPRVLLPLSAIIFGLVLLFGAWAIVRFNDQYTSMACGMEGTRVVVRAGVRILEVVEVFIGCGSVALGIIGLAFFGFPPVTLTLVALLGVGFSSLLHSTLFSHFVLSSLQCEHVPVG